MTDGHGFLAADLLDPEEIAVERSLRPRSLDEYLGQREVKAGLSVLLQAARQRGEAADHVLLHGPPGLGKTTLATIIARELGVNIRYTSGPAIERAGDLAAVLTALDERDVLFIDEIHRLNTAVEEILYPAMEDCALDVMIGKGPWGRPPPPRRPPGPQGGAPTRAGRISGPLRDRFGAVYRLDFYAEEDLRAIVRRSAAILGLEVTDDAAAAIAARGRATPRIVNRLLKRVRDHAEVHGDGRVTRPASRSSCHRRPTAPRGRGWAGSTCLAAWWRRRPSCRSARTRRSRRSTPTRSRRPVPRSSSPTRTTSTSGRGTSGSPGSAASTSS
jgi:Holliday junction DNA helicase RuvB